MHPNVARTILESLREYFVSVLSGEQEIDMVDFQVTKILVKRLQSKGIDIVQATGVDNNPLNIL